MRDRVERILKIVCCALAALLVYRIATDVFRGNPLARVTVPELPSLPGGSNAPAPAGLRATNAAAAAAPAKKATNTVSSAATNVASPSAFITAETNAVATAGITKSVASPAAAAVMADGSAKKDPNPAPAEAMKSEPSPAKPDPAKSATNAIAGKSPEKTDTNSAARAAGKATPGPRPDMATMGSSGPGRKPADLPPAIKARVDRIYDSEVFGPVMRPLPMALLGIAGNVAFLRSPTGQTGLAKEGEQVGELKLVKIGINRVLVEQDGEKKELMIFSGYGGESLLPRQQEGSK